MQKPLDHTSREVRSEAEPGSVKSARGDRKRGRTYHHGNLREALLAGATRLVASGTAIRLTVKELTDEMGVTPAAFYRHFTSVEQLLESLYFEGLDLLEQVERDATTASKEHDAGDYLKLLVALVQAYARFALEYPGHFRLVANSDFGARPAAEQKYRPAIKMMVDAVKDGQAAGQIIEGNPRDLAIAAWATLHGLTTLFTGGPIKAVLQTRPARAHQLEEAAANMIRRGLARSQV